ncbi:MAG TPA: phosphatase PAP2 family protein [Candidatus Rubrimentiphilum sp.]|nr:phosphatase PAP2 family protein [Candidatus Rubrimentiphilum sp.]
MSRPAEYYIAAAVLFVAFMALGELVIRRPALRVDSAAIFHSHATPLACILADSGRWPFITAAFVIITSAFAVLHRGIWIPVILIVSQLVTQALAELFKAHYRRVRPDYWIVGLDPGKSYPSGHAVTAVVFFCGWACVVAYSSLPAAPKDALVILLVAWAAGIGWSRLALGVHYLTDVAGGTLLGCAWLCAVLGAVQQAALAHVS